MSYSWTEPSYKFATTTDLWAIVEKAAQLPDAMEAEARERFGDTFPIDAIKELDAFKELTELSRKFLVMVDALGRPVP